MELVTQLAFYCGWPKAWSAFPLIAEVYGEEDSSQDDVPHLSPFPKGEANTTFARYFIGQSYLAALAAEPIPTFNVTFEPGCRNNWHIHRAKTGGGQLLICVYGRGFGKAVENLQPSAPKAKIIEGKLLNGRQQGRTDRQDCKDRRGDS